MRNNNKSFVAEPKEYPHIVPGYYADAFKKPLDERVEVKEEQRKHKLAIARDYPEYTASQRKRIMNPK